MATNTAIRAALLAKLGVTRQALSNRVQLLKSQQPMTTEDAVYVIAHNNGIDIGRYLDHETLARVRAIITRSSPTRPSSVEPSVSRATPARGNRVVSVSIGGLATPEFPGLSVVHAQEGKRMAEQVYPLLYFFENSARDLIHGVLRAQVGADWWSQIASTRLQGKASDRLGDEGREAWHGGRGAHAVFYVDLTDLPRIVGHPRAWEYFKLIFPRGSWFEGVVDDMNVSRRVVAHMNPLGADDIKLVAAGFAKWTRQLVARRAQIEALLVPLTD
jgi:hypothetical protein